MGYSRSAPLVPMVSLPRMLWRMLILAGLVAVTGCEEDARRGQAQATKFARDLQLKSPILICDGCWCDVSYEVNGGRQFTQLDCCTPYCRER